MPSLQSRRSRVSERERARPEVTQLVRGRAGTQTQGQLTPSLLPLAPLPRMGKDWSPWPVHWKTLVRDGTPQGLDQRRCGVQGGGSLRTCSVWEPRPGAGSSELRDAHSLPLRSMQHPSLCSSAAYLLLEASPAYTSHHSSSYLQSSFHRLRRPSPHTHPPTYPSFTHPLIHPSDHPGKNKQTN